jgi:maleylpyruvate isomerase
MTDQMHDQLRALSESQARLSTTVDAMTDEQAASPSRLPGWDCAMVVTHLARNADSNAEMILAKLRGEERAQYADGPKGRASDIEMGRGRPASIIAADLRSAAGKLSAAFRAVEEDQWDLIVPAGIGPRPIRSRVRARRLEVEVHHADLGLGYGTKDWPDDFVGEELVRTIQAAPRRRSELAQAGSWRIGEWRLDVADEVTVTRGMMDADGAIDGEARDLFAWLMGRSGDEPLTVSGDSRVRQLPRWFPFP